MPTRVALDFPTEKDKIKFLNQKYGGVPALAKIR